MADESFDLVFRGEVLEGQMAPDVKLRLTRVLKSGTEQVNAMFSGRTVILKRSVDRATAAQYQAVFKKAGARLRVVPVRAEAASPGTSEGGRAAAAAKMSLAERLAAEQTEAPPQPSDAPVGTAAAQVTADVPDYELAPPGADVLTEAERAHVEAPKIDTSAITVAPAGAALADVSPAPEVEIDTSALTLAELGADIVDHVEIEPPEVDTSGLSLAEVGADIGEPHDFVPAEVDVSGLSLAEPGADLAPGENREPPPAPDTSHLSVE